MKHYLLKTLKSAAALAALVFVFALIFTPSAESFDGVCGPDLVWFFDTEDGVLEISGTGKMSSYGSGSAPWSAFKNDISEVILEDGVESVGERAFYGCAGLLKVSLPESVTLIKREAFYGCLSLSDVYYDGAAEDFADINIAEGNENLSGAHIHCYTLTMFNAGEVAVSEKYAGVFAVSLEQTGKDFILYIDELSSTTVEGNISVFAASYDENGKMTEIRGLSGVKSESKTAFSGETNGARCKIFALDAQYEPVIRALDTDEYVYLNPGADPSGGNNGGHQTGENETEVDWFNSP